MLRIVQMRIWNHQIVALPTHRDEVEIQRDGSAANAKATIRAAARDCCGNGATCNQTVTIALDIDKGWHLYANPVSNDTLTTVQTLVKFPGKEAKITYPPGKTVKDKVVGDYSTYEGKVTIKAQIKRSGDDKGPLEFTIRIQACNKDSCLATATVKKSVP